MTGVEPNIVAEPADYVTLMKLCAPWRFGNWWCRGSGEDEEVSRKVGASRSRD